MARKATAKKKRFDMKVEGPVFITMRDGTRIACRIYRPDAPGKFPALFAASPYQYETDGLPHSTLFLWREVGPVSISAIRVTSTSTWTYADRVSRAALTICSTRKSNRIFTNASNGWRGRTGVRARSAGLGNHIMLGRSGSWVS